MQEYLTNNHSFKPKVSLWLAMQQSFAWGKELSHKEV